MPKYKIIDREGAVVLEASFDAALGTTSGPVPVKRGKHWGYVDRTGTVIVEPAYDQAGSFVGELGPVRKGKQWGFVSAAGELVVAPRFEAASPFIGGLAAVAVGGKWGLLDPAGQLRVEPKYDGITFVGDGRAGVNVGGKTFNGLVTLGGKWGIIDTTGKVILKPKYDTMAGFRCGLTPVIKSGKAPYQAYVGIDGKEAWKAPAGVALGSFSEDRAWGGPGGPRPARYQLLSRSFEWIGEPRWADTGLFAEGRCAVNDGGVLKDGEVIGGQWGYVDLRGELVIEPRYSTAAPHSHGLAPVKLGGRWGLVDRDGKVVIEPKYHDAFALSPTLAMVSE